METIPVSEAEVKTIIMFLKPKYSTGYGGIPNKILKYCVHSISKPLTCIYNRSLTTGIFPERCKFAIVRPIYKKGGGKKLQTNISTNIHVKNLINNNVQKIGTISRIK
jgi:hypothetical protein